MMPAGARRRAMRLALLCALWLAGCTAPAAATTPVASPSPAAPATSLPPVENQIRDAYRVDDPLERQAAVRAAANRFLRDESLAPSNDETLAAYFTAVAYSSGTFVLGDPAALSRGSDAAVIGLPEGMGLWLVDLSAPETDEPLELSRWTAGLAALDVTWGAGEAGISYATLGTDGVTRPQFILTTRGSTGWRVSWRSDEDADWWFNAPGATVSVADDLSEVVVEGPATGTTGAFYEQDGEPVRTFRLRWARTGEAYRIEPLPEGYPNRQAWLRSVAVPGPYTTLVEFIERLQSGDLDGAEALTSDPALLDAALEFELALPERRYQVTATGEREIAFRDVDGTYRAAFTPPAGEGDPWLVSGLVALGAPGESGGSGVTPTPAAP